MLLHFTDQMFYESNKNIMNDIERYIFLNFNLLIFIFLNIKFID